MILCKLCHYKNSTSAHQKYICLKDLTSLVVNVDVHLVVVLEDKSNYRYNAWWSENLNS